MCVKDDETEQRRADYEEHLIEAARTLNALGQRDKANAIVATLERWRREGRTPEDPLRPCPA